MHADGYTFFSNLTTPSCDVVASLQTVSTPVGIAQKAESVNAPAGIPATDEGQ
jgi:hypothetical protein